MDIGDVDGETIERAGLKDKAFEGFVKRLLRAERSLRHRADADIQGPVADYHGDDKRDLMFVVHGSPKNPRTEFTAALTWDELGSTWYSCKGGGSWRSAILGELGQAAYNTFKNKGTKPGPRVRKRPPKRLLDHVAKGGRYVFVISSRAIDDRDLLDEVAEQLSFWLDHEDRQTPSELRGQLAFIDANRLADFISTHQPELSEDQRRALGLEEPRGVKAWRQWTAELGAGRDLPQFEADAEREALFKAIADPNLRVLRIFGPPGVGKTRVVHEGIRRCGSEAQDRTRYSDDVDVSLTVVQDRWLRDGAKPWLVLDELRSEDVDQASAKFNANAVEGARLILLGTSDGQAREIPGRAFMISELDEAQTRRLIAKEASGLAPEQQEAIWQLSEGYPWYAVLLAQAVAVDDAVLDHGDDDATRWSYGTQRVLAGNPREYGGDRSKWAREAELRAKTLLVAMLTRDIELEWDELCERHGEGLRLAIAEPGTWDEVVKRERSCRERQLLRQSGLRATRRYVSPNNLARLILHHFLTDPDLGPKIRRHTPELRSTLVAVAKAVRVNPAIIERLARGEWDELERRSRDEGLEAVEAYVRFGDPSYAAAHDAPERAATTMATVITEASSAELARAGNLRAVASHVFRHVVHRKISREAFAAVEAALIALAQVDDSPFANNAEGIWTSLFLPAMDQTHQPWSWRRARLDERLADPDPFVRGLAIEALARGVGPSETGLGVTESDRADGDWPLPTESKLRERKTELWPLLLRRCEDASAELAARAQSVVAKQVRGGALGRGLDLDALAVLEAQVRSWHPAQRRELLEGIADLRRYDLDDYAERPELLEVVDALERAAAPVDLSEQVRVQFGTWHPGPWKPNDPKRATHERAADLELAQALLDEPSSLVWALDWSTGPEAHRAAALWFALGCADGGRAVFGRLVAALDDGFPPHGLGQYLLGWAEAASAEQVEARLFSPSALEQPKLMEAGQWFLAFVSPTRARLERLGDLVSRGVVLPSALVVLGLRGWAEQVEFEAAYEFLAIMGGADGLAEACLRFADALLRRALDATQHKAVLDQVRPALRQSLEQRVVIGTQPLVCELGAALAELGEVEFVSSLILDALTVEAEGSNIHVGHELLAKLFDEGHGEALWPALAGALVEDETGSLAWPLAEQRLLAHVPTATILDWVGGDRRRGLAVASLSSPHGEQLSPVVVELLVRFGDDSEVGRRLRSRALLPGVVPGGFVDFMRRQRDHARAWQPGALPEVQRWARALEVEVDEQLREAQARAELRAKYG